VSSGEKIEFKVTFTPKASWVDRIYLGNLLAEMLAVYRERSRAFEFEVSLATPPSDSRAP
jgi:hypothetical protein